MQVALQHSTAGRQARPMVCSDMGCRTLVAAGLKSARGVRGGRGCCNCPADRAAGVLQSRAYCGASQAGPDATDHAGMQHVATAAALLLVPAAAPTCLAPLGTSYCAWEPASGIHAGPGSDGPNVLLLLLRFDAQTCWPLHPWSPRDAWPINAFTAALVVAWGR